MDKSIQKAIEDITYKSSKFPEKPFQIIRKNKELAIPDLRAALEKAVSGPDSLEENYQLHFYALFLLGEFQDRESFPKIMELASLPGDTLDFLIGDAVTSGLSDILYNTYNGNLDLLKDAIQNEAVNEYARSSMLNVMGQLYLDGVLEKDEFQSFIRQIIHQKRKNAAIDYICSASALIICDCHFVDMLPDIKQLYKDRRIEEFAFGKYENCVDMMFGRHEYFCRSPINASEMLRSWAMFEDGYQEIFTKRKIDRLFRAMESEYNRQEKKTKIGRNDPCPCGSGKKYKNCCLNKPKPPIDSIESETERKKWLKDYPAPASERQEGQIYLEDYFDSESIEIDKLLYLALMHRPVPIWHMEEDETVENRKREYLCEAFSKFTAKIQKENIKTFQEYDEKYSIHYQCEHWFHILLALLKKSDNKVLYKTVSACYKKMKNSLVKK